MEALELGPSEGPLLRRAGPLTQDWSDPLARRKKKKNLPPRAKRMKRPGRLQSAKHWITKYSGENLVRGYVKHYGVDHLCAIVELRMLGVEVDPDYVERCKANIEATAAAKRKRKEKAQRTEQQEWRDDCDDTVAFIVGHTSGGVPFGVTWEQVGERPDEDDAPAAHDP